jgi:hypothetical protein
VTTSETVIVTGGSSAEVMIAAAAGDDLLRLRRNDAPRRVKHLGDLYGTPRPDDNPVRGDLLTGPHGNIRAGGIAALRRGDGSVALTLSAPAEHWPAARVRWAALLARLRALGYRVSAVGDVREIPGADGDPLTVLKDEREREIVRLRNEGYTWQEIGDAPGINLSMGRVKNILTDIRRKYPDLVKSFRSGKS